MRLADLAPALALLVACSSSSDDGVGDAADARIAEVEYVVPSLAEAGDACRPDWTRAYDCHEGFAEGQSEIGECKPGYRTCDDGVWAECLAQNFPEEEVCNRLDDDCDGEIDNALLDSCGRCEAVAAIHDCFGQDCERGFDVATSDASCADKCCDCLTFEAGATEPLHIVFDQCEILGCNAVEASFTSFVVVGETDGLVFETRGGNTVEALALAPFTLAKAQPHFSGAVSVDVLSGTSLAEVRISSAAGKSGGGTVCRVEPEYQFLPE